MRRGLFILVGLLISSCGDDVKTRRRTVYVDESGKPIDNTADQTAGTSTNTDAATTPDPNAPSATKPNSPAGTTLEGAITGISALGLIQGWAVNKSDLTKPVSIVIFSGENDSTGVELANISAALTGFDNNYEGNHRFEYQLAPEYRDGTEHKLFVVMNEGPQEGPLTAAAKAYTSYTPKTAGQQFYTANLQNTMQTNCGGCHPNEVNYDNHYRLLIDKSPAEGGTATTNRLIAKASGGLNHSGGNRCGNINNGICAQLQQWWQREFQ